MVLERCRERMARDEAERLDELTRRGDEVALRLTRLHKAIEMGAPDLEDLSLQERLTYFRHWRHERHSKSEAFRPGLTRGRHDDLGIDAESGHPDGRPAPVRTRGRLSSRICLCLLRKDRCRGRQGADYVHAVMKVSHFGVAMEALRRNPVFGGEHPSQNRGWLGLIGSSAMLDSSDSPLPGGS